MADKGKAESEAKSDAEGSESGAATDTDIIDSKLYGSLESYFSDMIGILESLAGAQRGGYPGSSVLNLGSRTSDTSPTEVREQDTEPLSHSLTTAWESFPGFSNCVDSFKDSDIYQEEIGRAIERGEIEGFDDATSLVKEEALPKILNRYLRSTGEMTFDKQEFKGVYSNFEDYLTKVKVEYNALAYLANFEMDDSEIKLDNDLKIREVDNGEIGHLPPYIKKQVEDEDEIFAIDYTFEVDKFGVSESRVASETVDDVILVLRLFANKGDVSYPFLETKPQSEFATGLDRSPYKGTREFLGTKYALSSEECEQLSEFWEVAVPQIEDPDDNYRVALDKFSSSFRRANENDRLLDCVIALEALYLKSGEKQEMSYRLSQRGALLLGNDGEDAKAIKDDLKKAYDLRSKLVHGSSADIDKEFVFELHDLTRMSLSTFISRKSEGQTHDKIIETLDDQATVPHFES